MVSEASHYFKYLDFVREDIREELDLLGVQPAGLRICDFGCGKGLTTFGLALEAEDSICYGIDLFDREVSPEKISHYVAELNDRRAQSTQDAYPPGLYELIERKRLPEFRRGNIVLNQNLPRNLDVAYCKQIILNLLVRDYPYAPAGKERLMVGLHNIQQSVRPGGLVLVVEYDFEFGLEKTLELSGWRVLRRGQITRREIRSRGRTDVVSTFSLYLLETPISKTSD
ncbi:MAG: hypothetical protein JW726_10290 [Anaerolineales bacterium]|nr:hypothetical protein [Anaerolineales bacterium]